MVGPSGRVRRYTGPPPWGFGGWAEWDPAEGEDFSDCRPIFGAKFFEFPLSGGGGLGGSPFVGGK